ncbi:MAG: ZIP family metal transporter [Burkholderiales bacterium]|nr:ZIP family metal transporter [Burkholderiales bacterium]MDE1927622.1 ZIP family metal transporter [Burkholderiales bacterium]MDE2159921.1 ZIP family metal transporter [Burkholderiales bacterium]MDE2501872.1 ZIP family metal transporter [Burkholderiales bacterium]
MTAVFLALATAVATLAGGWCALRFRDRLHYLLSFAAGVLLGVVCFELLPEAFELARRGGVDPMRPMVALVVGFLLFHSLEKFVLIHHAHESNYAEHRHPHVGLISASALVGHSLLDGVAIGLAFQVTPAVGIAVAVAVIGHDFCDGLNTVGLMVSHRNSTLRSIAMLALDAAAPLVGAASTLLFHVPEPALAVYLGFFAGFLLYIGVADILPEAHSRAGPAIALRLLALTALGAAFIYAVARLAG